MHPLRSIRRVALGAALTGAAIGAVPAIASAQFASKCTYDSATRTATVTVDNSGANNLLIKVSGGLLTVDSNALCVSSGFEFATPTNTDRLDVDAKFTHGNDGVTLDQSGGMFAPGFTPEADGNSELEIKIRNAGSVGVNGPLTIVGTPQGDVIRMAEGGRINFGLDDDTDVSHLPSGVTLLGGDGPDFLSGDGYGGRRPTLSKLQLEGGAKDDTLFGGTARDLLFGDGDRDTLRSVDQARDFVQGGSGFDNAIHDALDNVIEVESRAHSSVGRLRLAPRVLKTEAGSTARLTMSWKHPRAWRELRKVDLSLYRSKQVVGMINARPASGRLSGDGVVDLMPGSKLSHHGKWVTAKLALRLPKSLAGEDLRVDVRATDRDGRRQLERSAGSIRVAD